VEKYKSLGIEKTLEFLLPGSSLAIVQLSWMQGERVVID
jgi:hypothetical protein